MRKLKLNILELESAAESISDSWLGLESEMPTAFLNLSTGEVIWSEEDDDKEELWADENLLEITIDHSSEYDYEDMEQFVDPLDDPDLKQQLGSAISGTGAFRRFKDIIYDGSNVAAKHAWHWFQQRKLRQAIIAWLAIGKLVSQASAWPAKRNTADNASSSTTTCRT